MTKDNINNQETKSVGITTPKTICIYNDLEPLKLQSGKHLAPVNIEYEKYGEFNDDKSNVILVLHALTGDAHAAGFDSTAKERGFDFRVDRPGWWDGMIGPGKSLDTNKYCVICTNVIGSCYGSTGPMSINPKTNKPYGLSFPIVTIHDWIVCQNKLLELLGINKLLLAIGGSLGGHQALEWALSYPNKVKNVAIIASATRANPMILGINSISRNAIFNDPNFNHGDYYNNPNKPSIGLKVSRMLGHLTFLSHESMWDKFSRDRRDIQQPSYNWDTEFQIESYLNYQAQKFFDRFDPNCFLYFTKAMDYYDAAVWGNGNIVQACQRIKSKVLLVSYAGDWLYPRTETEFLANALSKAEVDFEWIDDDSQYGHDAFLVELDNLNKYVSSFLEKNK